MVSLLNLKRSQLKFKKAQTVVDLFLYFIIILIVLEFTYLFLFSSLQFKLSKTVSSRAISLTLQASEDLYLSFSKTKDNFVFVGVFDEDKLQHSPQQYKEFNNIFYSFSIPPIDFSSANQICIKRTLFSNSSKSNQDFWVCNRWG